MKDFDWNAPRKQPDEKTLAELAGLGGPAVSDLMKTEKSAEPVNKVVAEEIKPEGSLITMEAKPDTTAIKEQMQKILHGFIQKGLASPAFKDYAAKHNLAMVFTMSDIGLDFYFQFKDGQVLGDVKTPDYTPEVALKATASDMDGVLAGKLGGMKAATTGKLKFSGEVRKAMTMQKLMNDWIKLYSQAREEAGGIDPGLLTAPKIQVPSAAHVIPAAAESTLAPDDPRIELVQVTLELYAVNSITATGGNVSVRVPGTTDQCYITPSHLFKGNLRPEMMVRIDMNGIALDESSLTPSSEKAVHTEIYKARPDVEAIVHGHSPWMTLLMLNNLPLLPISVDAGFFPERIPCVPFIMPGTTELAIKVKDALGNGVVAYMQNHGIVVAGSSLRQAANNLEALERTAMLTVWSKAIRSNPKLLPKDVLKTLKDMGNVIG